MGFGSECRVLNGQVDYIDNSKLNIAYIRLISLDRVIYCNMIHIFTYSHIYNLIIWQDYEVSDEEVEGDDMAIADIEFKLSHDLNQMQVSVSILLPFWFTRYTLGEDRDRHLHGAWSWPGLSPCRAELPSPQNLSPVLAGDFSLADRWLFLVFYLN